MMPPQLMFLGGTMTVRRTAAAVLAVAALTLTGCSSNDERPQTKPGSSAPASPSADTAAAEAACKAAWTKYVAGSEHPDEKRARAACKGLPAADVAGLGADAIREHTAKNREHFDECIDTPDAPECADLP